MPQDKFNTFWGLTSDIKSIAVAGGVPSDDVRLSERQIFWWISNYYALFTRQEFERNPDAINPSSYLKYCIDLCECYRTECPECGIDPCCLIYRGEIPQVMELQGKPLISFVGSGDSMVAWSRVNNMASVRAFRGQRGNRNMIFYTIRNNEIVVDAPVEFDLTCGMMYAIPDVGIALPENCSLMGEMRIREDYIPRIRQAILATELNMTLQTRPDENNNTNPQ
jgi:hypothetical protein